MKPGAVVLGTIVSILLLALAGGLYVMAGNTGEQHYRNAVSLVRQIQQLSSNWSVEIARVKSDPFADFDSLAAFIPRMERLKERLTGTTRRIPSLPDRIANDLNVYRNTVESQEERIERFKTGYAVVRNSTRYLPLAAATARQQAETAGDEALVRTVSTFVQGMDTYLAAPSDLAKDRLAIASAEIRAASVAYPPSLANSLANLADHSNVLLDRIEPTEELFRRATSNEISVQTDRLVENLEFELDKRLDLATWYERGMMGAVGLLALFWIVLGLQQRSQGGPAVAAAATAGGPAAVAPEAAPLGAVAAGVAPEARAAPGAAPVEASEPTFLDRAAAGSAAPDPALELEPEEEEPVPATAVAEAAEVSAGVEEAPAAIDEFDEMEEGVDDEPFPDALALESTAPGTVESARDSVSEAAILNAFLISCTAENLAASTARATAGMERLRQAQNRIRAALQDSDALLDAPDGADVEEEMEAATAVALNIRREVNAIADVARRLASFESLPNGWTDHELVDVNACIEEAIEAAGAERSATVATRLGAMPEIFASKADLRLMLAEVIENSVQAVESLDDRPGSIKIDSARKNEDILITVIDNGVGMSPERRARIFTSFYTTRDGAVGLGLTFAGHLAQKYEGSIKVNSLPGQGTVARITLPAGPSEA